MNLNKESAVQDTSTRNACANPNYERSLLTEAAVAKWGGFSIGWIEAFPHSVAGELTIEKPVLTMIDHGAAQAELRHTRKSTSYDLTAGSIGFFAPGTHMKLHSWKWGGARRIVIAFDFSRWRDPGLQEHFQRVRFGTEIEFRDDELSSVVRGMANEVANGCPSGQLFAESLSIGVAMRLQQRAAASAGRNRERGKLAPAQRQMVEELIRLHLGREISISELAEAVCFSPAQFSRLFKNTLGCTPYHYVLNARLQRARELVMTSSLSLAVIAGETGFASQSHMTSAFVRVFKVPPGEMRRVARGRVQHGNQDPFDVASHLS